MGGQWERGKLLAIALIRRLRRRRSSRSRRCCCCCTVSRGFGLVSLCQIVYSLFYLLVAVWHNLIHQRLVVVAVVSGVVDDLAELGELLQVLGGLGLPVWLQLCPQPGVEGAQIKFGLGKMT